MGLFDTVRIEYLVDGKDYSDIDFQTKSLNNSLGYYLINKEGEMFERFVIYGEEWYGRYEYHGIITVSGWDLHLIKTINELEICFNRGKLESIKEIQRC